MPENLVGYSFIIKGKWGGGEDHLPPHSLSRGQAYITSSIFTSGRRAFDPVRSNQDCQGVYSNQQKGGDIY